MFTRRGMHAIARMNHLLLVQIGQCPGAGAWDSRIRPETLPGSVAPEPTCLTSLPAFMVSLLCFSPLIFRSPTCLFLLQNVPG